MIESMPVTFRIEPWQHQWLPQPAEILSVKGYAVKVQGERPIPLRTGRLGSRRRAEHAGHLRVARLYRRVARRRGVSASTAKVAYYIPSARVEAA